MELKNAFNRLDKLFAGCVHIDPNDASDYYLRRDMLEEKVDMLHDANVIDTKCSALLTHISIMFLVIGIFISKDNTQGIFFLLLVIEFIAYVLAAMLILRCVDMMGPPFRQLPATDEAIQQNFLYEITLRREIYVRVLRMVFVLTAVLIPIIVLRYFL
jgi:hypothetical protein